jgi:endonuclease/exonuclease/phosphatase (EEP) superfamily protein YafD
MSKLLIHSILKKAVMIPILASLCLAGITGFIELNAWTVYADLLCHFRAQYALIAAFLTLSLLLYDRKAFALLSAILTVIHLFYVLPIYLPPEQVANPPQNLASSPIQVMTFNVLSSNTNFEQARNFILSESPDVLVVLETNTNWTTSLEPLKATYPTYLEVPRNDNFGINVYSKLPINNLTSVPIGTNHAITGTLALTDPKGQSSSALFVAAHPIPAKNARLFPVRNAYYEALAEIVKKDAANSGLPTIMAGDFNSTRYGDKFAQFLRTTKLTDARQGFGIYPTWPAYTALYPGSFGIDYVLSSAQFHVSKIQSGPDIGSDHRAFQAWLTY